MKTAYPRMVVTSLVGFSLISGLGCSKANPAVAHELTARVESVAIQDSVLSPGRVVADVGGQVRVGPRISGRLKRLLVKEGDFVRVGQLVAELDDDELRSRLAEASAARTEAEISVEGGRARSERRRRLAAEGLLSQDEAEAARIEWERSKAALLRLEGAENRARVELGYSKLTAPITGVVTRVATQEGETVASSFETPTFLTILDPNLLVVEALVDEADIRRIAVGQKAQVTFDALLGETWSGRVRTVSREPTEATGPVRFAVVLDLEGGSRSELRPRLTATVEFQQGHGRSQLVVPAMALRQDGSGFYVLVRRAEGSLERRAVLPGPEQGGRVSVSGEIQENEIVILVPPRKE
ncbi:MAG: efflux RND transporter periplasmic adaptor subunit [Thermoanaerobaculia bacterium]|nr:efflux RND transporter periplasmic adaptor subunit [Thermoanaerobaculia bacterium]